ncbi:hypothetical protein [Spiroplasma sp. AdecLV25b]|uniref:hypothetical protein n=1 Tax=Spiroplasma sp. AdecLV25b TaxID=3027162 RepID=UPI0027DF9118|nr:hypothetical protein [Spiroplasma sp. AdecLV25b]
MKLKDINKEIETISKEIYQLTEQLNTIKNNKNFNLWNTIIPIIKTNILGGICTFLYVTTTGYNINYMLFISYDSCINSFPDYYDLKSNAVFKETFNTFMTGVTFSVPLTFGVASYNFYKTYKSLIRNEEFFKESVAKISKEINIRTEKVKTLNDKLEKLLVEQKEQATITVESTENTNSSFDLITKLKIEEQQKKDNHRKELKKAKITTKL